MLHTIRYYSIIACLLLAMQGAFWWASFGRLPDLGVVPDNITDDEMQMLSFGDGELLFRILAFRLNNTGDTFGRFTTLRAYDMSKIERWFTQMDSLDDTSNHLVSLSAYYFSQTQNRSEVRHLVNYLYEHSKDRPQQKWWWLTQATYLAMHKLEDKDLALKVATPLQGVRGIPYWAQQMPAFVHENRGEMEHAYIIMRSILESDEKMEQSEINYMKYFIEERLKRMHEEEAALLEKKQKQLDAASEEKND
jgi:hypothetical protein